VSELGTVLDPSGLILGHGADPAIVWDGTTHFVSRNEGTDIVGGRVSAAGANLDVPVLVSRSANAQVTADIAFDGTNHLVVWEDTRAGGGDVFAARVGADGTVLDGGGIAVARTAAIERRPSVSFDGTRYLVVWDEPGEFFDDTTVRAVRMSTGGAVVAPYITVTTTASFIDGPTVAFNGSNHLVVWRGSSARVSPAGTVLDPSGIPAGGEDVASDGSGWLVVRGDGDITAVRVSGAGAVVGEPTVVSATEAYEQAPAVGWDGGRYLVAWEAFAVTDPSSGEGETDVRGARVTAAGVVQDPAGIGISTAPGDQGSPTVAANGPFLVAWIDRRSGGFDIYAARVTGAGAVQDGDGVPVAVSSEDEVHPALAARTGRNDLVVAYQRFEPTSPFGAVRTYLRTVSTK
jgi:hypothetical protein